MSLFLDRVAGRIALVIGGGTGCCRGIALELARNDCDVEITSRLIQYFEPITEEISATGRRVVAVVVDVRDHAVVESAVGRTTVELGVIDILDRQLSVPGRELGAERFRRRGRIGYDTESFMADAVGESLSY
jgi:hypothetical protein